MNLFKDEKVKNAVMISSLCASAYLAVYIARNLLSAVSPQMIDSGVFTTEYIGSASSLYFVFYAVGQLINGAIGDKIKARYMLSFGLIFAGVCSIVFPHLAVNPTGALIVYALTGFFLSMIYGPMTKTVAENTEPEHAVRCSLGYTFSSFFGSPLAGVLGALLAWQSAFTVSSIMLFIMGGICFILFFYFEKKGIIKYGQYKKQTGENGGIKALIERQIIKFVFISVITGVVRTTVVFWLPTYISQHLGFSADTSAAIFTAATLVISFTAFIAVFVYERLNRNMDLVITLAFTTAAIAFFFVYFLRTPVLNIIFMVIAIMSSNCAASMMWSRYCPSLRDTGMVSSATGFLDFMSYMAAAISSKIFANAVSSIGWGNLIIVWFALMVAGVAVSFVRKK